MEVDNIIKDWNIIKNELEKTSNKYLSDDDIQLFEYKIKNIIRKEKLKSILNI